MSHKIETFIHEELYVSSWSDGDFEIEADDGERVIRVYLTPGETTVLLKAVEDHLRDRT